MSSPYPVLDNRPIDQWKVTELKDELRRRKLTIKGLKEDLIKRLDEALRNERENAKEDVNNGFSCDPQPGVLARDAETVPVAETSGGIMDLGENQNNKVDDDNFRVDIDGSATAYGQGNVQEDKIKGGSDFARAEEVLVVHKTTVETSVTVSESVVSEIELSGQESQNSETQEENGNSKTLLENEDSKPPHEDVMLDSSVPTNQVCRCCL
ncbi:hypothetical protein L1049_002662 [Liquidambar formosana]|uniref:SAP domain-containing protein n=1 Tax=Liquidambar formosana TaxID=63359 RepID=A0AAP0NHJ6_LIQFO